MSVSGRVADVSVARGRAACVYLNGGHVALQSDDLSDQLVVSDSHQLEHSRSGHVLGGDHCGQPRRSSPQHTTPHTTAEQLIQFSQAAA